MKKAFTHILTGAALLAATTVTADNLVLLHTNDTHSQLDTDASGNGGVLPRKALIDSIRAREENVILIDAGDVVQGSLYFKFFGGEVEYPLMDMMGYDIRILGNHEFDNGIDDIAKYYRQTKGTPLSANYDFSGTALDGIFSPYTVKEIKGRRIGFMGINIDPASLIAAENTGKLKYSEVIPAANATAAYLKDELKCDLVVAVTHIGADKVNQKTTDYELAAASRDIDIIIGGHSHTAIQPGGEDGKYPSIVANAEGEPVLVAQTGKYGRNLGYISIDLDRLGNARDYDYRLLPVTDRFAPEAYDTEIMEFLKPYRAAVDSINSRVIAQSAISADNADRRGPLANFTADFAYDYGLHKADSLRQIQPDFPALDFAIMNVGGIRMPLGEGDITEGQVLNTYPFSNHMVLGSIRGAELAEALKVAARKGGEAVSGNITVVSDADRNVQEILVNGYPLNPEKTYTYATIDYVFNGNDDLTPMATSTLLWRDEVEVAAPILSYIERMGRTGLKVNPDTRKRFIYKETSEEK